MQLVATDMSIVSVTPSSPCLKVFVIPLATFKEHNWRLDQMAFFRVCRFLTGSEGVESHPVK
jgi:hypothetical protein